MDSTVRKTGLSTFLLISTFAVTWWQITVILDALQVGGWTFYAFPAGECVLRQRG